MQPIQVRPTPRRSHRYKPEEMCGPLPPVVYKVLPVRYAKLFVERGEMMWSTLAGFRIKKRPGAATNTRDSAGIL